MRYQPYVDYFENIAIKLKVIRHTSGGKKRFCRMNIEEVLTGLKTELDLNNICLILEAYEKTVEDRLSDNLRDRTMGAFMILKKVSDNSFETQDTILSETEAATLSVWSKLKLDKRNYEFIKHIDLGTLKMNKVGPLWDKCYGWRTEFMIDDSLNSSVVYNENDWDQ